MGATRPAAATDRIGVPRVRSLSHSNTRLSYKAQSLWAKPPHTGSSETTERLPADASLRAVQDYDADGGKREGQGPGREWT
jgi:hypothetical protein